MNKYINVNNKKIEITNPDKILFPNDKISKINFIEYYKNIGPIMVPYMKYRPIAMHRYPDGISHEGFYHKDTPEHFANWIKTFPVKSESQNKIVNYVVVNNIATLVYIANFGCITPHLWLSKIDKLRFPDRMIFDFDPADEKSFKIICKKVKEMGKVLKKLKLNPFIMTTGSRGLHIWVPIIRKYEFDIVREYASKIADYLVETDPDNLTTEIRKDKRGKRIFIDFLRNSYSATAVAPYSIRAKNGAPIATPLFWEELDDPKLTAQKYNIYNIFQRLQKKGDPWENMNKYARSLKI